MMLDLRPKRLSWMAAIAVGAALAIGGCGSESPIQQNMQSDARTDTPRADTGIDAKHDVRADAGSDDARSEAAADARADPDPRAGGIRRAPGAGGQNGASGT